MFISGGSVLFIESRLINPIEALDTSSTATKDEKTGSLTLTGKLGDVMKESCKIALTHAKLFLQQIDPNNRSLRTGHIHIHVPEVNIKPKKLVLFGESFVLGCNAERWSIRRLYDSYSTSITWFK